MKKLLLILCALIIQSMHASEGPNVFLGVLPTIIARDNNSTENVLVYVDQDPRTKKISVLVTPFDQRRLDHGNRLSNKNFKLYGAEITKQVSRQCIKK